MTAIITFYSVVVFVHVIAVVAGLGTTFVYPIFWRVARYRQPRNLPFLLATQDRIGKMVIGPSVGLILASGLYMVISEDGGFGFDFGFVQAGLTLAVVLLVMGPLYFGRREAELALLSERDIAASGSGKIEFSGEFDSKFNGLVRVARATDLAILVVIFLMVVKP